VLHDAAPASVSRPDDLKLTFSTMTDSPTRREFLELAASGLVLASLGGRGRFADGLPRRVASAPDPDLVVLNAKVYTMDGRLPRAEAFAIKSGHFVAVGTTREIEGLATRRTQRLDAKQMTIVPGFIDCHNHAGGTTLLY
jgi:hypothetical protein